MELNAFTSINHHKLKISVQFLNINTTSKKQQQLNNTAINFLNHDSISPYIDMTTNGYIPTPKIQKKYHNKIINLIDNNNKVILAALHNNENFNLSPIEATLYIKSLNHLDQPYHLVETNIKEVNNKFLQFILENQTNPDFYKYKSKVFFSFLNSSLPNYFDKNTFNSLAKISIKDEYQQELIKGFFDEIKSLNKTNGNTYRSEIVKKCTNIFNLWCLIDKNSFKSIPMESYLHYTNIILNLKNNNNITYADSKEHEQCKYMHILQHIGKNMNDNLNDIYSNQLSNILNDVKIHSLSQLSTKKAIEQITNEIPTKFNTEALPKESIIHIDKIQEIYIKIINNNTDCEFRSDSNKLIHEKLPKIIHSYLSMNPEYRITMKNNQGKNSQDLLIDSLQFIEKTLQKNLEALQKDKLVDLSAQTRFLKNKST